MNAVKILRGCGATGGQSLLAGRTYAVPSEVSEKDADLLIRLGKAEVAELLPEPTKSQKKKEV